MGCRLLASVAPSASPGTRFASPTAALCVAIATTVWLGHVMLQGSFLCHQLATRTVRVSLQHDKQAVAHNSAEEADLQVLAHFYMSRHMATCLLWHLALAAVCKVACLVEGGYNSAGGSPHAICFVLRPTCPSVRPMSLQDTCCIRHELRLCWCRALSRSTTSQRKTRMPSCAGSTPKVAAG